MKLSAMIVAGAAGLTLSSIAMAQNNGFQLTDGDAVFRLGTTSTGSALSTAATGATYSADFRVAGGTSGTDLTFGTSWFYRAGGMTRENGLSNANVRVLTGTNKAELTFNNLGGTSGLMATVGWILTDTGANTARVVSYMFVTNNGPAAVSLDLFHHYDHDIAGSAGDTVDPLVVDPAYRQLTQRDTAAVGGPWSAKLRGYGANGSGNGGFSAISTQLTDTSIDNFIPDLNPGGQGTGGDYAYLMQWRYGVVNPGESVLAWAVLGGGNAGAEDDAVPTPGTLALLGLSGLAMARRRR